MAGRYGLIMTALLQLICYAAQLLVVIARFLQGYIGSKVFVVAQKMMARLEALLSRLEIL